MITMNEKIVPKGKRTQEIKKVYYAIYEEKVM